MKYILAALLLLTGAGLAQTNEVRMFVQSGLLNKTVIRQLESKTGLNLRVSTYDSAEEAIVKVVGSASTAYDLVVLPDYLLPDLIKNKNLKTLERTRLTNLKNLETAATKLSYDPGNRYSVGLLYSMVGLAYLSDKVSPAPSSWSAVLKPTGKIPFALLDGYRETMAIALIYQKQKANATDEKLISAAVTLLQKARSTTGSLGVALSRYSIEELQAGRISMAMTFSHDALQAGGKIRFAVPREGSVRVLYALAIPAKTNNSTGAHKVMNALLEANLGKLLSENAQAATPNQAARKLISSSQLSNANIWPSAERLRSLSTLTNHESVSLLSGYWIGVKQ